MSQIDTILGSGILNETRVSHHYPTVCFYDLCIENKNNDNKTTLPHYDYCESNINEFNSKLVQKLSVESFRRDETGFCKFTQCIQNECFLVEPEMFIKSSRNRLVNPWINGLISSMNYKNFLYENWKKSKNKKNRLGDSELYEKYESYRKKLRILVKCAKSKFYSERHGNSSMN